MSLVTDFATAMHSQAAPMIGQEPVVILGTTLSCVLAEVDDSADFSEGGFEPRKRLTAVCLTSALPSAAMLKKAATARGQAFRVEGVSKGGTFTTLTLEEVTKA